MCTCFVFFFPFVFFTCFRPSFVAIRTETHFHRIPACFHSLESAQVYLLGQHPLQEQAPSRGRPSFLVLCSIRLIKLLSNNVILICSFRSFIKSFRFQDQGMTFCFLMLTAVFSKVSISIMIALINMERQMKHPQYPI